MVAHIGRIAEKQRRPVHGWQRQVPIVAFVNVQPLREAGDVSRWLARQARPAGRTLPPPDGPVETCWPPPTESARRRRRHRRCALARVAWRPSPPSHRRWSAACRRCPVAACPPQSASPSGSWPSAMAVAIGSRSGGERQSPAASATLRRREAVARRAAAAGLRGSAKATASAVNAASVDATNCNSAGTGNPPSWSPVRERTGVALSAEGLALVYGGHFSIGRQPSPE